MTRTAVLLKRAEVLEILGVSEPTLRQILKSGQLAAPVRLPSGGCRYRRADVEAFLANLPAVSESAGSSDHV
jgi:predicted DNA-binding transcriptional regulator AlpA